MYIGNQELIADAVERKQQLEMLQLSRIHHNVQLLGVLLVILPDVILKVGGITFKYGKEIDVLRLSMVSS